MLKKININKILKKNPHINKKELEDDKCLAEELRKVGIQPRGYQLAPPFARQRAKTIETDEVDPRTINLTASRL